MPPDNHGVVGVALRSPAAPIRLRFGPFLPGRPLPRSDGEDDPFEESGLFSSISALFQRHFPPTQTDVGLHMRSRLSCFHTLRESGWETAAVVFGRGAGVV